MTLFSTNALEVSSKPGKYTIKGESSFNGSSIFVRGTAWARAGWCIDSDLAYSSATILSAMRALTIRESTVHRTLARLEMMTGATDSILTLAVTTGFDAEHCPTTNGHAARDLSLVTSGADVRTIPNNAKTRRRCCANGPIT